MAVSLPACRVLLLVHPAHRVVLAFPRLLGKLGVLLPQRRPTDSVGALTADSRALHVIGSPERGIMDPFATRAPEDLWDRRIKGLEHSVASIPVLVRLLAAAKKRPTPFRHGGVGRSS